MLVEEVCSDDELLVEVLLEHDDVNRPVPSTDGHIECDAERVGDGLTVDGLDDGVVV